jgi:hypothetical protein
LLLRARSEIYRHTMQLEIANIQFSIAHLRGRFKILRSAWRLLGIAAPLVGFFVGSRRTARKRAGIFSALISAARVLGELRPIWQSLMAARGVRRRSREREGITEYP